MAQPSSLLGDALFDVVLCAKAFGGDYDTTTQVLHTEHDRLPISHSANRVGRNRYGMQESHPDSSRCLEILSVCSFRSPVTRSYYHVFYVYGTALGG